MKLPGQKRQVTQKKTTCVKMDDNTALVLISSFLAGMEIVAMYTEHDGATLLPIACLITAGITAKSPRLQDTINNIIEKLIR